MSRFIVIEGLDGAGTTTQARRLADTLASSVLTHEPTDRPVGQLIRRILQGDEGVHRDALPWLFAADRKDHVESVVLPALERGDDVVSDRYFHSSLAYQSLVLPLQTVWQLNATFPVPDLTLFLEIDVERALDRIAGRAGTREIFEKRDTLESIAAQYEEVLDFLAAQGHQIARLDAGLDIDTLHQQIRARL